MGKGIAPFVSLGLFVCEKLNIYDKDSQRMIMKFCKMYPPQKIADITNHAKTYVWWQKNPKAAFMKAVGEINRKEKTLLVAQ